MLGNVGIHTGNRPDPCLAELPTQFKCGEYANQIIRYLFRILIPFRAESGP